MPEQKKKSYADCGIRRESRQAILRGAEDGLSQLGTLAASTAFERPIMLRISNLQNLTHTTENGDIWSAFKAKAKRNLRMKNREAWMFYPTEAYKKRMRRIRFQIMLLEIKKKLTGSLSASDEKKLRQLLQELAIKY